MKRQSDPGTNEVLETTGSGGATVTANQGTAGSQSWKVVEDNSAAIKSDLDTIKTSVQNIPSSPSTSAKQDTGNTALASIATSVANIPASPATSGKQDTGNTSVGNIDTNTGAKADSKATDSTSSWSVIALLKGLYALLAATLAVSEPDDTWTAHHVPSSNTQATITKASAGGGVKNVCTGLTVTLASSSTSAPAAIQLTVALIDGATGGGTYLWRTVISLPATAGAIVAFQAPNGKWVGSAATAMTLEFSAAGGANTIESVSMRGYTK